VWPGKPAEARLATAAFANKDRPDHPVTTESPETTEDPVDPETKEAQAKMQGSTLPCFQFHLIASARPSPVQPARRDRKEAMVNQARVVVPEEMDNPEVKDQLDQPVHPDPTATPDLLADLVNPVNWLQVVLDRPDQRVAPAARVNPVRPESPAKAARTVAQAVPAQSETPEQLVVLASLAAPVKLEALARMVYLALAITARQLVWLQVIKRSVACSTTN